MNFVNNIVRSHKKLIKIALIFLLFSFFLALILFPQFDNTKIITHLQNLSEYLTNHNINFIAPHFIGLSLIISCSLTLIGLIFIPIYVLYELLSILYSFYIFTLAFRIKGFIYAILFNLITKGLYLFFLIIIIRKIRNIVLILFKSYYHKEDIDLKYSLFKNIKAIVVCLILTLISDILISLLGTKILLKLTFLIP